ncbi:hypothetical protein T11_12826 [Trichinella zimbabwensis]|uniref:Uncharacterized protein n=1 Tax=Trichinella zimbabwensis TaxID=268475 RepID=A0A0V1I2E9_9BILA|nr:hypothetical protein T11_12826 [Trichinella zimbabwensis]
MQCFCRLTAFFNFYFFFYFFLPSFVGIFLPLTLANVHSANRTADRHVTSEHLSTIKYSTASYDHNAQQHQHSPASLNNHQTAHGNNDGSIRTNEHPMHPDVHSIICDDATDRLKHLDMEYKGLRGTHISNDPSVNSHPIQKAVDSTIDVIRKNIQCGTFKNMFPSRHNNNNGNTVHHRHGNRILRPAEDIQDGTALQNSIAEYDVALREGNLPLRRRGRLRGRILQPVIVEPVIISDTKTNVLPGGEESFVNPLRVRSFT